MKRSRGQDLAWRALVKASDEGRCRRCGRPGAQAHHIATRAQRPDLIYTPSNGAYLCTLCHVWVHEVASPEEAEAAGLLSRERYENRSA